VWRRTVVGAASTVVGLDDGGVELLLLARDGRECGYRNPTRVWQLNAGGNQPASASEPY